MCRPGPNQFNHPEREPGSRLVTATMVVTIAEPGGSDGFGGLLAGYLRGLVDRGCHCLIIASAERDHLYVQAIATPAGIRIEACGRHYQAAAGHEPSAAQMLALAELGFLAPPEPHEDPNPAAPRNWWRELTGPGHLEGAARQLVAGLEALGIGHGEPLVVEVFPADRQDYRWQSDPDHPCGGYLTTGPEGGGW